MIDLKKPFATSVSPDGGFVAYTVQQPNWAQNNYETQIWLANTQTGQQRQLTTKGTTSDAEWSPDGRWLGFISNQGGNRQIYLTSPAGGEARCLTTSETGVAEFHWSPDANRIAFTMTDPEIDEIKRRKEKYSDFEVVGRDYRMNHLWLVDLDKGAMRRLTEGRDYTVGSFSWSPDGSKIAFDAQTAPTLAAEMTANLYLCDVASGSVKKLINEQGPDRNPQWSPDGKSIAFETVMGKPNYFTQNFYVGIVPAAGGSITNVTADFDERVELLAWGGDGIYFSAPQKTATHLFRVDAKTHSLKRVTPLEDAAYSGFTFTKDFKKTAFIEGDATRYPEVYLSELPSHVPKRMTNFEGQLKDLKLARREIISWKNSEGIVIEGVLIKPDDFDPSRKYPLMVVLHGGPAQTWQAIRGMDYFRSPLYPQEIWAGKGALVLEPNYRGSNGYGIEFHRLIVRKMGAGSYDDIISGVDDLISKGWVDKDRVGAVGWSFGGFISAWIATNSDRFKAISVGAGPTDWVMFDAATALPEITRQYLGAAPSNDPEIYRISSPITNIKQAKTPTMIEHGDRDPVAPLAGAYELYQGLLDRRVPTRFYLFHGYGHNIATPKGTRAVMEQNLNWFNHYLWGEPDSEAEK